MKNKIAIKKIFCLLLIPVMFVACGKRKITKPEDAVNGFFTCITAGDYEHAMNYCLKDSAAYNVAYNRTREQIKEAFIEIFSEIPEAQEQLMNDKNIKGLTTAFIKHVYGDYKIMELCSDSDDSKAYSVMLEVMDIDGFYEYAWDVIEQANSEYYYNNYERINELREEQGETAAEMEIIKNTSKSFCQIIKDRIINNPNYSENVCSVTVQKVKGEWLVSEVEM